MELLVELVGMKAFKGTLEGKPINGGSLYTMVKLDERYNKKDESSTNWKFGNCVEEWKVPDSEMVMRLAHLNPSIKRPVTVRLEVERVSNGRETREVVINCVPLSGVASETIDTGTGEIKRVDPSKKLTPLVV